MRTLLLIVGAGLLLGACSDECADRSEECRDREVIAGLRIALDEPAEGSRIDDVVVMVRGRARSDASIVRVTYRVNDVEQHHELPGSGESAFGKQVTLRPGTNVVEVVVTDARGREERIARTVECTAGPPEIISFTASPAEARPGGPVDLQWEVRGDEPLTVTIAGLGVVTGGSVRVWPEATTDWSMQLINHRGTTTASVRSNVVPELVPTARIVAAGSDQIFSVAGAEGPFEFSASAGTVESLTNDRMRWSAPAAPGTYELRALHRAGEIVHPVEVRIVEPLQRTFVGIAGQPGLESEDAFVADANGGIWGLTDGGVVHRAAGSTQWILRNEGLAITPNQISIAADGTVWLAGLEFKGYEGETYVVRLASWDAQTESWAMDPARPWVGWNRLWSLAHGPDGSMVLVEQNFDTDTTTLWRRPAVGSEWERGPTPPASQLVVAADGTLFAARAESTIFRLATGSEQWERLEIEAGYLPTLHFDPSGALVAADDGVFRLLEDGSWEDLSAGLPTDCSFADPWCRVEDLTFVGETWFAATEHGIFAREPGGSFALAFPLPALEVGRFGRRALVTDSTGALWLSGASGVWHLPSRAGAFFETAPAGLPGGGLRLTAMALGPDGTLAIGTSHGTAAPGQPGVALLRPGAAAWSAALPGERGEDAYRLEFAPDGSLLVGTSSRLLRSDSALTTFETLPLDGLPERPHLATLALEGDGSLAVVGDFGFPFRLVSGGTSWTALPPREGLNNVIAGPDGTLWGTLVWMQPQGVVRLKPDAEAWEQVGYAPGRASVGSYRDVVHGPDGQAWVRVDEGIMRLEDGGVWRPVGSGACTMYAERLLVTRDGRVICSTSNEVYQLDPDLEVWVPFGGIAPGSYVDQLGEGPEGRIFVAFQRGLFELHEL